MPGSKKCQCGHPEWQHRNKGPCCGSLRVYISQPPRVVNNPETIRELTKEEAEKVVNEAHQKVQKAPSYQKQFEKMMRRGYLEIDCQCEIFHTVDLPERGIIVP